MTPTDTTDPTKYIARAKALVPLLRENATEHPLAVSESTSPSKGARSEALSLFNIWYHAHQTFNYESLGNVLSPDVEIHSLFSRRPVAGRISALKHFRTTVSRFSEFAMPLVSPPAANGHQTAFAEVDFTGRFSGELTWRGTTHKGKHQPFRVPGVIILHTTETNVSSVKTLFDRDDWLCQIDIE
ncbi:hypothetical protein ACRAJ3_18120 [Rhodococcus pyridinivorans]|uniref:hypothetical protein n=1 Tax=Rhodococcus TaxID=1827 RepID=UPI001C7DF334|nr:hypothetical protein [Rhodococcus sp. DMU2021]MBX4171763.1 hypothetical protein [Rhodococcus sp. DMU2021]